MEVFYRGVTMCMKRRKNSKPKDNCIQHYNNVWEKFSSNMCSIIKSEIRYFEFMESEKKTCRTLYAEGIEVFCLSFEEDYKKTPPPHSGQIYHIEHRPSTISFSSVSFMWSMGWSIDSWSVDGRSTVRCVFIPWILE